MGALFLWNTGEGTFGQSYFGKRKVSSGPLPTDTIGALIDAYEAA